MDRVPPPPLVTTDQWSPKIKAYPHFDQSLTMSEIQALVTDPSKVTRNTFYPFLMYEHSWQPFRNKPTGKPARKTRPIRYASRRGAYIYSYYRYLLSEPYERLLGSLGIGDCVSAYRKIRQASCAGKSNIEFARDAFDQIAAFGSASVIAVDISSFFESLDHEILRTQWRRVMGFGTLPADHAAVFRAITRYAVVDRDQVYRRLGFLKDDPKTGAPTFTLKYNKMPRKLCGNADFRTKICGHGGVEKSLIDVNRRPYGIPQGSPISDMLANIYMLDFDVAMHAYCAGRGGIYRRYSDDALMIIPGPLGLASSARDFVVSEISKHGSKLKIKASKTAVLHYAPTPDGHQTFCHISGEQGRNGLEYLGFRYDGREIRVRDATLSRLYRKISSSIRAAVISLVSRYPGKGQAFLEEKFDYSCFFQRFGRVDDFDPHGEYDTWTFWTYATKATAAFGTKGRCIPQQLSRYKEIVRRRVSKRITEALSEW